MDETRQQMILAFDPVKAHVLNGVLAMIGCLGPMDDAKRALLWSHDDGALEILLHRDRLYALSYIIVQFLSDVGKVEQGMCVLERSTREEPDNETLTQVLKELREEHLQVAHGLPDADEVEGSCMEGFGDGLARILVRAAARRPPDLSPEGK